MASAPCLLSISWSLQRTENGDQPYWMIAVLGAHPQVCTAQEMKVFDLFTAPWERSWLQLGKLQEIAGGGPRGLRSVWTDDEFYARLGEIVTDVYGRVMATKPGACVMSMPLL